MKTPKVTIDRPPISSEEILARKNFKALQSAYQQQVQLSFKERIMEVLMKNRLNFMSVAGVTTAGVLIVTQLSNAENKNTAPVAQIESTSISVVHHTPETLNTSSEITPIQTVPEENVQEEETVLYPATSAAAIIPAIQKADNTDRRNDSIQTLISKEKEEITRLENIISALESTKPAKPEKPKGYRFTMDIDPKEFPKISKFKNVLFEVAEDETSFSPEFMKMEWDKGKISKDDNGKFKLTLTKDKKTFSFKVFQVDEKKGYAVALKEYEVQQQAIDSLTGLKTKKVVFLNHLETQNK